MNVSCSTLSFARLTLEDALRTIRDLHFQKVDLAIRQDGPHLTPADVAKDVNKLVAKLKAATIAYSAIYCGHYDSNRDPGLIQFRAVCRLARLLAIPTITICPDATATDVSAEAAKLQPLVRCAMAEGLELCVETSHPNAKHLIELIKAVPGLRLTLDPSHYVSDASVIELLVPFVSHVRLRDSGKTTEQFQVCVGQGEIDFGRIISQLEREDYDRSLTVDIRDVADSAVSVDAEVRKLKYLLESLV